MIDLLMSRLLTLMSIYLRFHILRTQNAETTKGQQGNTEGKGYHQRRNKELGRLGKDKVGIRTKRAKTVNKAESLEHCAGWDLVMSEWR